MTTLIASEVERVRAPERASEEAATSFQRAVLARRIDDRDDLVARGKELGIGLRARGQRGRRARPSAQPDRGRLAPAAARRHRPRRPLDRPGRDLRAGRVRRRRGRRPGPRPRRRHRSARRARRSCASSSPDCPGSPSRSAAAATPRIRSTCTAPATRRCWRPTSSRAITSARSSPTRRPAPTSCCSRT